jgi:dTDP-glucose 4,6-dehydratase
MINSIDLDHILEHTQSLWGELRNANLFITGGTGFFGKWLIESLLWATDRLNLNSRVTILTRSPDRFRKTSPHLYDHQAVSTLRGDIRTFDFPSGTFTHIIHAATESSAKLNAENPLMMLDTIVQGTRHTLDFAKTCGAKKLLFTSSGAIYGKQPPEMTHISEEYTGAPDPIDPKSAYGEGKRLAEHLCALYADQDLEIKIARGFAFVGPYLPLDSHFAIGNFIRDAINGYTIVITGDGTPYRSYLYAADMTIWLWTVLLRGESLRVYNLGSDEDKTIEQVARLVATQFQHIPKVKILRPPTEGKLPERYVPSITRARQDLGLDVWIPVDNGISRTIQFYREDHNESF